METLSNTNMKLMIELMREHKKRQIPFVKQQFIRELVKKDKNQPITKRDIMNAILHKNERELSRDDDDDHFQARRGKSRKRGRKSRKRGCKSRKRSGKSRKSRKRGRKSRKN